MKPQAIDPRPTCENATLTPHIFLGMAVVKWITVMHLWFIKKVKFLLQFSTRQNVLIRCDRSVNRW